MGGRTRLMKRHRLADVSNPKNQAERAPILLSRAWSGLDTSFHESYRWCWD